ncbi:MAG: bifunctional 2-polyprenyl-6-hydroxyphenol methylase/3-demethylubiquinol 3-O-methyltransferase UbiG, partial [Beijerinckiaceae bacterium]
MTGAESRKPAETVDAAEVARFNALAADWWNPKGSMAPLHAMNPVRLGFIRRHAISHFGLDETARRPLTAKRVLDVGCGGGILSEPMARLGAVVTGLDPADENIGVARTHAAQAGLAIDYREETVESVVAKGERFDIVL